MKTTLKFIPLLTKEEIINLINYAVNSRFESINEIVIYSEEGRKDENGNNYYYIAAYGTNNKIHVGNFKLNDNELISLDFLTKDKEKNYNDRLHEFLAVRFGDDYISFLYDIALNKAKQESDKLFELINPYKKIKKLNN